MRFVATRCSSTVACPPERCPPVATPDLYLATPLTAQQRTDDLDRAVVELQQLEFEILELQYLRRARALERVRHAVRSLGELGSPGGILGRAAEELGVNSQFDRVLISEVRNDALVPHVLWIRDDVDAARTTIAQLRGRQVALGYPLVEAEVLRNREAQRIVVSASHSRTPAPLASTFGWESYVVAALAAHGTTFGLVHADATASGRALDAVDLEVTARYAEGLAGVFERAFLREMLRQHRHELQTAIQWMSGRLNRLSTDVPATLGAPSAHGSADASPIDALTSREVDVLRLMARGQTNAAIAKALVVREGTVKYHVKNILRKLGATSRADAVARYARAGSAAQSR